MWERYTSEAYFRTTVQVVALQAAFVGGLLLALNLALRQSGDWFGYTALFGVALLAGVALVYLTTAPVRQSLRNQKLFISNIAHELRTPLSIIKTTSEVALLDPGLSRDTKRSYTEIIEELNRISEIINNLLSLNNLTRPERARFINVDLGAVLDEVAESLRPLARERGVTFTSRSEAGSIVLGNRSALTQVAHNIIKNGILFTPKGGSVAVRLRPEESRVILEVRDSGMGMSEEELRHIFEPFYRADSSRNRATEHTGSGLGLTIAQEMVRAHHGSITIDSAKRKGTTVVVLLPRGGLHHT